MNAPGAGTGPLRMVGRMVRGVLMLAGAVALASLGWILSTGISAKPAPGAMETAVARQLRHWAIPRAERTRPNPEPQNADTLRSGLEHFADHCASCHGNDGGGDTALGRGLYPRAPDMRLPATQALSDGELFYLIEHGVKLTGMPAWGTGTPEGEAASWHLVQFIRRLPSLTEAELEEMKALNPRSEREWRDADEMRRFLAGEDPVPAPTSPHDHGGPR